MIGKLERDQAVTSKMKKAIKVVFTKVYLLLRLLKKYVRNSMKTVTDVAITCISLIRALRYFVYNGSSSINCPLGDELCVLGNGPSLNDSLNESVQFIASRQSICVNEFIKSDYFNIIKPRYYVLLDPAYWMQDSTPEFKRLRESLFVRLSENVDWPLTIIIPAAGKNELNWKSIFNKNEFIDVFFLNVTSISGYEFVRHFLYKYQIGMPHAQNVLVAALYLGINMGYKRIYLFGADHSWHEDLFVNNDNIVCMKDKHFYDNGDIKAIPFLISHDSQEPSKFHEILLAFAKMFEGYHQIEAYAKYKKTNIYNASSKSSIDAFTRCSLGNSK